MKAKIVAFLFVTIALHSATTLLAQGDKPQHGDCKDLPSHAQVLAALKSVVDVGGTNNSGFGLNMWATTVNRDGEVCAVAFTGGNRGDQWPGSRVISAQKANTANSFSLPGLALSTAKSWRYRPAVLNGVAVKYRMLVQLQLPPKP